MRGGWREPGVVGLKEEEGTAAASGGGGSSSSSPIHKHRIPTHALVVVSAPLPVPCRYIAVEFAGIFQGLGAQVHLMYRADKPLRG